MKRIADRIDSGTARRLLALLDETVDDQLTRFVWLRQFEAGANSADINRMLDRFDYVRPGRPRYPVLVHRATALLRASFRPTSR